MSNEPTSLRDDEIDLVEAVLAVWEKRWLVLATFLTVFGFSLFFALRHTVPSEHFHFKSSIALQVGWATHAVAKGSLDSSPLGPSAPAQLTAEWLFNAKYLPEAERKYLKLPPSSSFSVSVVSPRGTNILSFSCSGQANNIRACDTIITAAVHAFQNDNEVLLRSSPFSMKAQIIDIKSRALESASQPTGILIVAAAIGSLLVALLAVLVSGFVSQLRDRIGSVR